MVAVRSLSERTKQRASWVEGVRCADEGGVRRKVAEGLFEGVGRGDEGDVHLGGDA